MLACEEYGSGGAFREYAPADRQTRSGLIGRRPGRRREEHILDVKFDKSLAKTLNIMMLKKFLEFLGLGGGRSAGGKNLESTKRASATS